MLPLFKTPLRSGSHVEQGPGQKVNSTHHRRVPQKGQTFEQLKQSQKVETAVKTTWIHVAYEEKSEIISKRRDLISEFRLMVTCCRSSDTDCLFPPFLSECGEQAKCYWSKGHKR